MLEVRLLCVGKLKEAYWRDAVAEYEKRLGPLCKFKLIELPEARLPNDPSPAQIAHALEQEGAALLEKAVGKVIPLVIEGREVDSPGLAKKLAAAMQSPGAAWFLLRIDTLPGFPHFSRQNGDLHEKRLFHHDYSGETEGCV